jgi:hypothetical protein
LVRKAGNGIVVVQNLIAVQVIREKSINADIEIDALEYRIVQCLESPKFG